MLYTGAMLPYGSDAGPPFDGGRETGRMSCCCGIVGKEVGPPWLETQMHFNTLVIINQILNCNQCNAVNLGEKT